MQRALQVQEADWIQQPSHHPEQEEEEEEPIPLDDFYCPLCDKSFKSQKALANHERLNSPFPPSPYATAYHHHTRLCPCPSCPASALPLPLHSLSSGVACPNVRFYAHSKSSLHTNPDCGQVWVCQVTNGYCECGYCCFCGLPSLSKITLLLDEVPWQG